MATKAETNAETNAGYAAGLIQGITPVPFPAASTIFTSGFLTRLGDAAGADIQG